MARLESGPDRRQVLTALAVGVAAIGLPMPSESSRRRVIRYVSHRMSQAQVADHLRKLRQQPRTVSQLVIASDKGVLILVGSVEGSGMKQLEI